MTRADEKGEGGESASATRGWEVSAARKIRGVSSAREKSGAVA